MFRYSVNYINSEHNISSSKSRCKYPSDISYSRHTMKWASLGGRRDGVRSIGRTQTLAASFPIHEVVLNAFPG